MTGVSFERRNGRASLPAAPSLGFCVHGCTSQRLAVAQRAGGVHDLLTLLQAGPHRHAVAHRIAHGDPAQLGAPPGRHEDAGQVAALHQGGAGHPDPGACLAGLGGLGAARQLQPGEGAGPQLTLGAGDAGPDGPAVGDGVAALGEGTDGGGPAGALGLEGHALPERQAAGLGLGEAGRELQGVALQIDQRLARADQVARLHLPRPDCAGEGGAELGVAEVGAGRGHPGLGLGPLGGRLVQLRLGGGALGKQGPDPLFLGGGGREAGLRRRDGAAEIGVGQGEHHLALLHLLPLAEVHGRDVGGDAGGEGGALHRDHAGGRPGPGDPAGRAGGGGDQADLGGRRRRGRGGRGREERGAGQQGRREEAEGAVHGSCPSMGWWRARASWARAMRASSRLPRRRARAPASEASASRTSVSGRSPWRWRASRRVRTDSEAATASWAARILTRRSPPRRGPPSPPEPPGARASPGRPPPPAPGLRRPGWRRRRPGRGPSAARRPAWSSAGRGPGRRSAWSRRWPGRRRREGGSRGPRRRPPRRRRGAAARPGDRAGRPWRPRAPDRRRARRAAKPALRRPARR